MITLQLSKSVATVEEEIVGVSVRLNQAMRQRFPKHCPTYSFEFPEAWVAYFKTGSWFVGLFWLFTGINGGKILFLARSMWNHVIFWTQSIVISFIHYWYTL